MTKNDYFAQQITNVIQEMVEDIHDALMTKPQHQYKPKELIMVNEFPLQSVYAQNGYVYASYNGEETILQNLTAEEILEIHYELTKN